LVEFLQTTAFVGEMAIIVHMMPNETAGCQECFNSVGSNS